MATTESVRLSVLNFGIKNPFRICTPAELSNSLTRYSKDEIKACLDWLVEEGVVTRFAGRYCFNREIPSELRMAAHRFVLKQAAGITSAPL